MICMKRLTDGKSKPVKRQIIVLCINNISLLSFQRMEPAERSDKHKKSEVTEGKQAVSGFNKCVPYIKFILITKVISLMEV